MFRKTLYHCLGIALLSAMLLAACQTVDPTLPMASPLLPRDATPAADEAPLPPVEATRDAGIADEPAGGTPAPFRTLAQGDSYTANQKTPLLLLAQSPSELRAIADLINDPETTQKLLEADLSKGLVVAVFRGVVGSSGYDIAIQSIQWAGDKALVTVELTDPAPDQMNADVISFPYHAVQTSLDPASLAPDMLWTVLTADGELLTTTQYP